MEKFVTGQYNTQTGVDPHYNSLKTKNSLKTEAKQKETLKTRLTLWTSKSIDGPKDAKD